jgi:hypothetical protein
MKRMTRSWLVLLVLLAGAAMAQQIGFAKQAQQETSAGQFQVFLPSVSGPGTSPNQPPPDQPPPDQPVERKGFFALTDYLTYNAATAIDGQGGMHLAFYVSDEQHQDAPLGQPALYTYCSAGTVACADPSKWSDLVQMDTGVNEVQIVATSDGRPRLLIRRNGSRGYEYDYWACEQQCASGQSWSGLFVTEAAGVEMNNATYPQHSFTLDSQGRPRFVWSNSWGNSRRHGLYYASCDATDCTQLDTWQHSLLHTLDDKTVTAGYSSLVFDGDKPRFVTRIEYSGLPVEVRYYACDAECQEPLSWSYSPIPYPDQRQWDNWDLALDAQGRPRVALYEPANIDLTVGGRLFYAWCDSGCADGGTPFQMVQIAGGEGQSVDMAIDANGRTHMVYDAGQRGALGELWCDAGCAEAGSWKRRILETSEQLMQEFAPASPLTCSQQERAWLDSLPQVAFDAQGRMVVAYDMKLVARCFSIDPTDPTRRIYSEVKRIWWAVRLVQFTQS